MLQAVLRRKLTRAEEGMEDLLTSSTFGVMVYLPPEQALLPFLRGAVNPLTGQRFGELLSGDVRATGWQFWPRLAHPNCTRCEPDVELTLSDGNGSVSVLIEAKYRSGKSSFATGDEHERPNDQLAREYDNLKHTTRSTRCAVVYVTADPCCPESEIRESAAEYRAKRGSDPVIYWTSWRFLAALVEVATVNRPGLLRDMREFLLALDLTTFSRLRIDFGTPQWMFHTQVLHWHWNVPALPWQFVPAQVSQSADREFAWALPRPDSLYQWGGAP